MEKEGGLAVCQRQESTHGLRAVVGKSIFSAKVSIASGSKNCEHAGIDLQQRHVEGTTTEIKNEDVLFFAVISIIQTIGYSSSSWFVDDTKNVQSCDGCGVFGRLMN